jgi:transposase
MTVSMASTITNRGELRFMVYRGAMTARLFITFLRRLIKSSKRKVFLIVDRLPAHRAKSVTAFIEENRRKLELFFLPPYAPEVNPDEYLNNSLKQRLRTKPTTRTPGHLAATVRKAARSLQRDKTSSVASFDIEPSVTRPKMIDI